MVKEAEFKCPFAAAYMMQHFDVSIMVDAGGESDFQCYGNPATFFEDRFNGQCPGRILVDPEGPWPFEPQTGDIVMVERHTGVLFPTIMMSTEAAEGYRIHTILSRNGKPFIMPEIK